MNRREAGFVLGVLAGVLLLAGVWLVSLLIAGAFVVYSAVEEITRQRHRTALLAEVVQFRVLVRERHLDVVAAYLAFGRRSLVPAAHAPADC